MSRFAGALLLFACLAAGPLQGAGPRRDLPPSPVDGLFTSRTDLVKTTVGVGAAELEIYARPNVDVGRLVGEIDRTKSLRSEDLYARISASRQRLYRNEPLIVVGNPGRAAAAVGEKGKLVRFFYLWDDESFEDEVWYTTCPTNGSTVAVLFVSLFDGEEDFFVKKSTTASYTYIGTVDEFGSIQYLTYSQTSTKKTTLGFGWDTISDSSGHIIVYCYL